jgi:hypothetical protein
MVDRDRAQWFLDFMYSDFQRMGVDDLYDKFWELNSQLGSPLGYRGRMESEDFIREKLSNLQKGLHRFFRNKFVSGIVQAEQAFEPSDTFDLPARKVVRRDEELALLVPVDFQFRLKSSLVADVAVIVGHLSPDNRGFLKRFVGEFGAARIKTVVESNFDIDGVLLQFLLSLDGLQMSDLGQCRATDCERWFIRRGKRRRNYCSSLCASRDGQRRRRATIRTDPQKDLQYKEDARKRAEKSYIARLQKEIPGQKLKRKQ